MYFSIISSGSLLLPGLREIADSFHVADNAGQIIHVLAMTFRTLFQVSFVNVVAFVADRVRYIESKVIAALSGGYPK